VRAVVLCLIASGVAFAQSPEEKARQALDLILSRKYEQFYSQFSPEMKKAISLETYSAQADQIQAALGKPKSQDPPSARRIGDAVTVTIPVRWSEITLNFIVSWNAAGQIQGTWFRQPAPPAAAAYETPAYSKPASFSSRNVAVGDDDWKLPGTLTVPNGKGPFAAVVLVHGSGPHDRDETIGNIRVFRDIAEGLATRGVAVLRYEKRTKVYPQKCAADVNFTMTRETVDDAVRAAALLRKQPEIDARRVFVLGHSQGGYMAPRIAKADPELAGIIVIAGNVRPLEELVVEQTEYLMRLKGDLSESDQAQLNTLRVDPWKLLPGINDAYKADLKGYDPAALAATTQTPMLILQGERDYQVTLKDFNLWKAALASRGHVTMRTYPKLNHLFIVGEGKSTPDEYKNGHVAAEVIEDIAKWLGR
jgi:dienelactone hydrolase